MTNDRCMYPGPKHLRSARSFALTAIGVAMACAAGRAFALPFAYDESVDGDLPSISGAPLLLVDTGANTVSGTTTFATPGAAVAADPSDAFRFVVPDGEAVTSIRIAMSLLPVGAGTFVSTHWILLGALDAPLAVQLVPIPSTGLAMFSSVLPLDVGNYAIALDAQLGTLNPGEFWSASYAITLEAAPSQIPAPPTLALFAVAMLGLGLLRKNRHFVIPRNPVQSWPIRRAKQLVNAMTAAVQAGGREAS